VTGAFEGDDMASWGLTHIKGLLCAALFLLFLWSTVAVADVNTPLAQMRQTLHDLLPILSDESLKAPDQAVQRRTKISQVLSQRFAYAAMAQDALGEHWQALSKTQQENFIPLFSSLLEREHVKRIEKYGGSQKSVSFVDETIEPDGQAIVQIEIADPRDPTSHEDVKYLLEKQENEWFVHDILIENSSMVRNYRTQFDKIIRQESYDELLRRLQMSPASAKPIP
jgi:phospholipid transport system substrate-binding protein